MGPFDHLQKGGSFTLQARKPSIRKVIQTKPAPSKPTPAQSTRVPPPHARKTQNSGRLIRNTDQRASKLRQTSPLQNRKRRTPELRLSSDDDASDTEASFEARKRARTDDDNAEPDPERRVRSLKAFSEEGAKPFPMVHAADITSGKKAENFTHAFGSDGASAPEVLLQYPSISQKERYQLVSPKDKDDFTPTDDILQVVEVISQNYVPEEETDELNNETTGIKRRLRRALSNKSAVDVQEAVVDYNNAIERLRQSGGIAKRLDSTTRLNLPLVECILTQIYSRTVSPRVESLRQYENGSDNVYGELLPRLISTMFKETGLKSGQVFVDLGSGVGNVVLQAALEIGCESWGCEMMQNACDLADLQQAEFKARCRLWGIAPGRTRLVRGDFLQEGSIIDVLKRADVILINNQAFTPELNQQLINHFLDMKEGCQIVSLKSFVPAGHKIQSRNLNSPINLLRVKQREYWSKSVSWTDASGTYFIATKDSSRLKSFVDNM